MKRCALIVMVLAMGWCGVVGLPDAAWTQEEHTDAASQEVAATAESETAVEESASDTTTAGEAAAPAEGTAVTSAPAAPTIPGLISVDFKDADIRQVLRIISLKSGTDIVAGIDVEGLVTIKLTNVPWEQALEIILRTYGFTYERKGNIVRVMTVEALESEALSTEVFPLDYAKAKEVPDVIKEMLSDRGKVKFDERTNTVIVTDIPTNLFQIKEVVERLDQRTPQVLVETKVVETRLNKSENLGIDWSDSVTLTQTPLFAPIESTFPFRPGASFGSLGTALGIERASERPGSTIGLGVLSSGNLTATLNFLQSRTDTQIVSNPSISALNNQEAKIHIGSEFPIPNFTIEPTTGKTTISGFTSKNIGTVFTVTPHVNPSQEIVVDLKPEVITSAGNVTYDTGQGNSVSLPEFTVQSAQTHVRIKNGETIAIGGLVKQVEQHREVKVPLLGDIPLIGLLFKSTSRYQGVGGSDPVRQDLLIFLTVKIMEESGEPLSQGQTVAAAPIQP